MAKRCPRGFICTDWTSLWLGLAIIGAVLFVIWFWMRKSSPFSILSEHGNGNGNGKQKPTIVVVSQPQSNHMTVERRVPDFYPEPVRRARDLFAGSRNAMPSPSFEQVGILTAEGGSSSSASPDRTILPLYGRELDARRGKWNYYTRTDGTNPVQVPVRVRNRVCDDDTVGCEEISSDDSLHVPALGRSFTATIYKKSLFR